MRGSNRLVVDETKVLIEFVAKEILLKGIGSSFKMVMEQIWITFWSGDVDSNIVKRSLPTLTNYFHTLNKDQYPGVWMVCTQIYIRTSLPEVTILSFNLHGDIWGEIGK